MSASAVATSLRAGSIVTPRKPRPAAASARTGRLVFPDPAGEHERVEPVHRRRHRGDLPPQPMQVHLDREARRHQARLRCGPYIPQITGPASKVRQPCQPRATIESVGHLGHGQPAVLS